MKLRQHRYNPKHPQSWTMYFKHITCCKSNTRGCTQVMWTLLSTSSILPFTSPTERAFITSNSTCAERGSCKTPWCPQAHTCRPRRLWNTRGTRSSFFLWSHTGVLTAPEEQLRCCTNPSLRTFYLVHGDFSTFGNFFKSELSVIGRSCESHLKKIFVY